MTGRKRKVKTWMEDIYNNVERLQDIFNHNLITPTDVGQSNFFDMVNKFEDVLVTIEDILFELDGRNYGEEMELDS